MASKTKRESEVKLLLTSPIPAICLDIRA
jgi:hypothetical protein